jgi:hypothetical protein
MEPTGDLYYCLYNTNNLNEYINTINNNVQHTNNNVQVTNNNIIKLNEEVKNSCENVNTVVKEMNESYRIMYTTFDMHIKILTSRILQLEADINNLKKEK